MKVLHLIPYMHPSAGGPPVVVDRWCVELQKQGTDVHVLTTDAYNDGSDAHWVTNYQQRFPVDVVPHTGPRGFGFGFGLRKRFLELLPQYDLVHVHNVWSYANILAGRYCARFSVPFVVSTHGMLDPHSMGRKSWKKQLYGKTMEWRSLWRAAGMLYTHEEEQRLASQTCATLPQGHVVSLGVDDPPDMSKAKLAEIFLRQFPQCRHRQIVMLLSRLHSKKGLDLLLPAMKRVLCDHPQAVLVLAGPGEAAYIQRLRQEAVQLGIEDAVLFTGPRSGVDKWAALAAADVFVLPSYQENFAIALVEALRVGTPAVISNRVNIWSDLIEAGAAVRCDLDSDSVATLTGELLDSAERRASMGEQGRLLAQKKFTWSNSTNCLIDAYSSITR